MVLVIYLLIMLLNIVLCRLNALMDAEREDVHKGYLPLNFVCIIKISIFAAVIFRSLGVYIFLISILTVVLCKLWSLEKIMCV